MEDFDMEDLIEFEPDPEAIAKKFLKTDSFIEWHKWVYNWTLSEAIEDIEENSDKLEYIWGLRGSLSKGVDELIEHYVAVEDYETCALLKAKEKQLRYEALQLEMKLENYLL